jgi:hypothetical protein
MRTAKRLTGSASANQTHHLLLRPYLTYTITDADDCENVLHAAHCETAHSESPLPPCATARLDLGRWAGVVARQVSEQLS